MRNSMTTSFHHWTMKTKTKRMMKMTRTMRTSRWDLVEVVDRHRLLLCL
jgi:hypothetical protein